MNDETRRDQMRAIGERFRAARKAKGISGRAAGRLSGTGAAQVSRLETGARLLSPLSLLRLCDAVGVSVDWVLSGRVRP